jgi:hypothetical protein
MSADKLAQALQGLLNIVADSRGVDGYHLNGDVAEWDGFPEVEAAEAALAAHQAQQTSQADILQTLTDELRAIRDKTPWSETRSTLNAAIDRVDVAASQVAYTQKPHQAQQAEPVGRVRFDSGEVHFYPFQRDAEASPLADGAQLYAAPQQAQAPGWQLVPEKITEEQHVAACKVLLRANGLDGLPQRMLDAIRAAAPQQGDKT